MPDAKDTSRYFSKGLLVLMIGVYILDQVTKLLIVGYFDLPSLKQTAQGLAFTADIYPVIDGVFNIVRVHNTGVAFGLGNGTAWSSYVFLLVPIAAIIILVWTFRKGFFNTFLLRLGWALLIAGVAGNLTDRLIQGFILNHQYLQGTQSFWDCLTGGYVVDFVDITIPWINYTWPAFNVADSCICVAAVLFIISSFLVDGNKEKSSPST